MANATNTEEGGYTPVDHHKRCPECNEIMESVRVKCPKNLPDCKVLHTGWRCPKCKVERQ